MIKPKFSFNYDGVPFSEICKKITETDNEMIYSLEDGLTVQLKKKYYTEYDATEWVIYWSYSGEGKSKMLSQINDCDILVNLPEYIHKFKGDRLTDGAPKIIKMKGCVPGFKYRCDDELSATEFSFHDDYIWNEGQSLEYTNTGGVPSNGMMPFFEINQGDKGAIIAIGWTGGWKAQFTKHKEGIVAKTGMKRAEFCLNQGECIRTTSFLVMEYDNGSENASNKFRRLIKNHFSCKARRNRKKNYLVANELWGGLTSEEMIKRIGEYKKYGIVFDQEWIDAGWYGSSKKCDDAFEGDWASFTGDWYMNPRIHKNEMLDVKEACESAGMRLMFWIEPERILEGTDSFVKHPEYVLRLKDEKTGKDSPHCLMDLGNDAAREYVFEMVCHFVDSLNMECFRQDFNFEPELYWDANEEEGRKGIREIKHVMGLYRLWDDLLEKYPDLMIDNCASGGRRIDIETLKRAIPFFRSDYQCEFNPEPDVTQTHGTNISRYLPYTGCTTKVKSDTYSARSTYASSWGGAFYNAVFQSMTDADFKWAKAILEEYRSVRKYFSCDFYNHGAKTMEQSSWGIWQYDDFGNEGIIMAFRRCKSPMETAIINLKGIDRQADYEFFCYDNKETKVISGAELLKDGFSIRLDKKYSSALIKYRRKNI